MTRPELENKMAVLLGGRAAEHIAFDQISTGAADDLVKVTDIARSMVMRYGMDEGLGNLAYEEARSPFLPTAAPPTERAYSEETARRIDEAVRDIVARAFDRATAILERNRSLLEDAAKELLAKETLNEPEIAQLASRMQRPAEAVASVPVAASSKAPGATTVQPVPQESEAR